MKGLGEGQKDCKSQRTRKAGVRLYTHEISTSFPKQGLNNGQLQGHASANGEKSHKYKDSRGRLSKTYQN